MTRRDLMAGVGLTALASVLGVRRAHATGQMPTGTFPITRTDAQWRSMLTPDQYAVLRQADTEQPYSSPLLNEHRDGVFSCAGCAQPMFSSHWKYDSRTGWPSFYTAVAGNYATMPDHALSFTRTEIHCARCGSHLGHIFDDGPPPTGLRHCMDGLALIFQPV